MVYHAGGWVIIFVLLVFIGLVGAVMFYGLFFEFGAKSIIFPTNQKRNPLCGRYIFDTEETLMQRFEREARKRNEYPVLSWNAIFEKDLGQEFEQVFHQTKGVL